MMLLRAVIIDDEQRGIDTLKILLGRYVQGVKIVAECTMAVAAIENIENYKPDIVFLDINMPEMNGFELLKQLAWRDFNLVFTTAHQEFGLKALKNNAIDYLLKPIDPKSLVAAVDRIKKKTEESERNTAKFNYEFIHTYLQAQPKQRIQLNSKTGIESVDLMDIICFEAVPNYTKVYLLNSPEILTTKTLKQFEQDLCGDLDFMRVHQSFIVNLRKVSRYLKISDCVVMITDQRIPVARGRRKLFFKWLES